jgi:O-antigen/teichoic acid export membrane protein
VHEQPHMFSTIKNLSKHTIIYGVGDNLAKAIGFLLIPLYTHYLATEQYGTLELLDLTTYVIGLFLAMGVAPSVVRFYYEYEDRKGREQVISSAMISIWVVSLSALGLLILFSRNISVVVFAAPDYYRFFQIVFITMVVNLSNEIPMTVLRIEQKSVLYVSISLTRLTITLFLNIWFIVYLGMGIMGILVAGLISTSLAGVFLTVYMLRRIRFSCSLKIVKEILRFGLPLIGSWLGAFVLHFGDRFLLQRLDSLESVGIYALAYKFGMMAFALIITPFSRTWSPTRFEIVKQPDAEDVFSHVFTYVCFAQLFASLGIAVLAKDVLRVVADEAYWPAHAYVPVILLGYLFYSAYLYVQFGVLLKKKTKYLGVSALIVAVVNILLNYLLIPRLGIWGAALATALSFILLAAAIFPFAQRLYRINYQWGRLLKMTVVAVALYFLAASINPNSVALSLVIKFLVALSFPLILYVVGFLTTRERDRILGLWQRLSKRRQNSC